MIQQNTFARTFSRLVFDGKVHIHILRRPKILKNLYRLFVLCPASQRIGGDFAKFCGPEYMKFNQAENCNV